MTDELDSTAYQCGGPDCSGHTRPERRCLATGTEEWTAEEMAREVEILDPRPMVVDVAQAEAVAAEVHGTEAPPTWFLSSGLSIAETTTARLAADPASATVPFEAGGALHIVERCGCSDCETAFARQFARSVADAEAEARDELLANGTPVGRGNPNVCEHGYRFENALCPIAECAASAHTGSAAPE